MRSCGCEGGQAIAEYALLFAVAVAAITTMELYAKRAIQAGVKQAADRLSPCHVLDAADNPSCGGVIDTNGEMAQRAGLLNETGDHNFQLTRLGQVLESQSAQVTTTRPEENQVHRRELLGGRVIIETRQRSVTTGALPGQAAGVSSVNRVVVDDAPGL